MPLFRKKADVDLELDRDTIVAGEPVRVRARVPEPDTKTQGGQLQLLYRNTYKYEGHDNDGDRTTYTTTKDVVVASEPLFAGGAMEAGEVDVELPVPPAGPPSDAKAVEWRVQLVLDRRMARDAKEHAGVTVLGGGEAYAAWAQRPPSIDGDVPMELDVEPRDVRPGDTVRGELRVTGASPLQCRSVRVQLRRRRVDQDGITDEETHAVTRLGDELELGVGETRAWPFELVVPPGARPTFEAEWNRQHWFVEGVLDRKLRGDHVVRAELNVFTA